MTSVTSPATTWSLAFIAALVDLGVQDLVVSPGSRSQALALAADALTQQEGKPFRVHVCIDERTAGFFGLGLAAQSGVPTALLCTSGSAPAHYFPALLEAKHSGIPLIFLTADRPEELRRSGANQTTSQNGLFGHAVQASFDVPAPREMDGLTGTARALAREAVRLTQAGGERGRSGPIHMNIAFREPLSSPIGAQQLRAVTQNVQSAADEPAPPYLPRVGTLDPQSGTVVIAGHLAGPGAAKLARDLGAALIAEVHSGARFGKNLVVAYRELLENPLVKERINRVVCVGRPTLAVAVQELLSRDDIEQVVWQRDEPEPSNLSGTAQIFDHVQVSRVATEAESRLWVSSWVAASREQLEQKNLDFEAPPPDALALASNTVSHRARFAAQEMAVFRSGISRAAIAREVWAHTWPSDQLILGSSRMIREFDGLVSGKKIPVWSNRGLSGIDGTIATARGFASARSSAGLLGLTRVVLGDLAFLHDAGSLLLSETEADSSRLQILVVTDGGGSIFDTLEVAQSSDRSSFERVIFTPTRADCKSLAKAYGWRYRRADNLGSLIEALADTSPLLLVECPVERRET